MGIILKKCSLIFKRATSSYPRNSVRQIRNCNRWKKSEILPRKIKMRPRKHLKLPRANLRNKLLNLSKFKRIWKQKEISWVVPTKNLQNCRLKWKISAWTKRKLWTRLKSSMLRNYPRQKRRSKSWKEKWKIVQKKYLNWKMKTKVYPQLPNKRKKLISLCLSTLPDQTKRQKNFKKIWKKQTTK